MANAAGCYAPQVAQMVGLSAPMANALHSYLITDVVPEFASLDHELPVMRDDYISGYVRPEQQSGLIGIYEQHNAEAAWLDGPDWSLESPLFPADAEKGAVFTQVYGWERPKWYPTVASHPQTDAVAFRRCRCHRTDRRRISPHYDHLYAHRTGVP